MSRSDLATLSLLDPDQGICPSGHVCRQDSHLARRICEAGDRGHALLCWSVSNDQINLASALGADPLVVDRARSFVANRDAEQP